MHLNAPFQASQPVCSFWPCPFVWAYKFQTGNAVIHLELPSGPTLTTWYKGTANSNPDNSNGGIMRILGPKTETEARRGWYNVTLRLHDPYISN